MALETSNAYLSDWDNNLIRGGRKICLFVDNCPAHEINVKFKKTEIQFIPPNTISLFQHLDGGIIWAFNSQLTARKLNGIFDAVEQAPGARYAFKKIDLKNGVIYTN